MSTTNAVIAPSSAYTGSTCHTGYCEEQTWKILPGLTFPSGDRFRLSVALAQWSLALDDGVVRTSPGRLPTYPWMDGLSLLPMDNFPEGFLVLFHDRKVQIYRMSTPLEKGLIWDCRTNSDQKVICLYERNFKRRTA